MSSLPADGPVPPFAGIQEGRPLAGRAVVWLGRLGSGDNDDTKREVAQVVAIITISRGSQSGGAALARALGEKLGLKVISREVIIEAAKNYDVSIEELDQGINSPPSFWDRLGNKREHYTLAVQATLAEMVEGCDVIYHGLAGHLLLKGLPCVLKIRLIAPMAYRLSAAMAEHGMTREQALAHIHARDRTRQLWVQRMYGVEWTDPALYDLVVNLEHVDLAAATAMVEALLARPEFQVSADCRREARDFALACRVRAHLRLKSSFAEDAVRVVVRNGVVNLTGGAELAQNRKAILSFVKRIRGVTTVTPDDDGASLPPAEGTARRVARDIMVPLGGYPHVHATDNIGDVMLSLGGSSVTLEDGHRMTPRFVLVFDADERLVGVAGRRNLLRGLMPQYATIERVRERMEGMASMADFSMPLALHWDSLFSPTAVAASWSAVAAVMDPIRGTVHVDDPLGAVVTTMMQNNIDLVPVLDGEKTVGVILMTDVFYTVAQHVLEKRGKGRG
jgi:cytidylate kinase/CBS domain-containing protein